MLRDNQSFNQNIAPNAVFLADLRTKLPEFFTADKVDEDGNLIEAGCFDLDKFQNSLRDYNVRELTSGYRLDFIGKDYAKKQAGERPTTVILPDREHNEKAENKDSQNLFLTGDNLEVLRHLQTSYENKVDVIYIDPPYNTGSDGFVYPDKFEYSDDKLRAMFGLSDDELKRLQSIQGRASHSAWLTFMYPRLYLAKRLLKESGVIFVSIDDNEQANLKLLMDEIFGEGQFVSSLAVENNPKGRKNGRFVSVNHEILHIYAKNIESAPDFRGVIKKEELLRDDFGLYSHGKRVLVGESTNPLASGGEKDYSVYYNSNSERLILKKESVESKDFNLISSGFKVYKSIKDGKLLDNTYTRTKFLELYEASSLIFKEDSIYEKDRNVYKQQKSLIKSTDEWDLKTETAAFQYRDFDSKRLFSMPKNVNFIKMLLKMVGLKSAIILDFFAGSATTADAVMQLNAEDGGQRRYIMVQLPEPTFTTNSDGTEVVRKGSEAAYDAGFRSIDEISRRRIELASQKLQFEKVLTDFDGGFKHYLFVSPTQKTLEDLDAFDLSDDQQLSLLEEVDFSDMLTPFSATGLGIEGEASGTETILTTWLVADGYGFDEQVTIKHLADYPAYHVQERFYLIESGWTSEQTKLLVNALGKNELTLQTIVIYAYSFSLESLRELELALKQLNTRINLIKRY